MVPVNKYVYVLISVSKINTHSPLKMNVNTAAVEANIHACLLYCILYGICLCMEYYSYFI